MSKELRDEYDHLKTTFEKPFEEIYTDFLSEKLIAQKAVANLYLGIIATQSLLLLSFIISTLASDNVLTGAKHFLMYMNLFFISLVFILFVGWIKLKESWDTRQSELLGLSLLDKFAESHPIDLDKDFDINEYLAGLPVEKQKSISALLSKLIPHEKFIDNENQRWNDIEIISDLDQE